MTTSDLSAPSFGAFGLHPDILKGIAEAGFTSPSPIQEAAIPLVLQGGDLIAQARTGTGKTAAFGLPLMSRVKLGDGVQILVMSPTRELAAQVSDELFRLGRFAGIKTVAVYGGQSAGRQIDLIRAGAHVVVATPGRLLDLLESKRLGRFAPSMVVLDEADEMLAMGFIDDIRAIFAHLPEKRQTLLFSATMPQPIKKLAREIQKEPGLIDIASQHQTSADIEQVYCVVEERERTDAIMRLIDSEAPDKSILFCRTRRETDDLCTSLVSRGSRARALHGDIDQPQRLDVIKAFRDGSINVLVATDVAARGLDVTGVTHVFNFHLPFDKESYVHRIGRTGRAGAKGKAITLVTPYEFRKLRQIEQAVQASFVPVAIPTLADVGKMHDSKLVESILAQRVRDEALEVLEALEEKMDLTQIACKLISLVQAQRVNVGPEQIGLTAKQLSEFKRRFNEGPRGRGRGFHGGPPPRKRFGGGGGGGGGRGEPWAQARRPGEGQRPPRKPLPKSGGKPKPPRGKGS